MASDFEPREEQDLCDRVIDKVNADAIRELLVNAKEETSGDFSTSGTMVELAAHLKRAMGLGCLTSEKVLGLLQEAEENGGQTILYYTPKTQEVRDLCSDPKQFAERLFGASGEASKKFPSLPRLKSGWEIVDFRTPYAGKAKDWLLKLYTFQETKVQGKRLEGEEFEFALKLKKNEYAVIFELRVVESVCVARWNDHPTLPFLELRVELAGRLPRFKMDINAIWSRLKDAFKQEDFDP